MFQIPQVLTPAMDTSEMSIASGDTGSQPEIIMDSPEETSSDGKTSCDGKILS